MAGRHNQKENNTKKVVISVFFAFIMVSSVLAIIFSGYGNNADEIEYNGYVFTQQGNYLVTKVDKTPIRIQSYPSNLATIPLEDSIASLINSGSALYISTPILSKYKEYAGQAAYDLADYLSTRNIQSRLTISDDNTGYPSIPLITCANATSSLPVLVFEDSNQSSITREGDCIRISGAAGDDFIAYKDRLVLKLSGIMP